MLVVALALPATGKARQHRLRDKLPIAGVAISLVTVETLQNMPLRNWSVCLFPKPAVLMHRSGCGTGPWVLLGDDKNDIAILGADPFVTGPAVVMGKATFFELGPGAVLVKGHLLALVRWFLTFHVATCAASFPALARAK